MKKNKVSTGTITRTVLLALALINQVLVISGKSPIPIDEGMLAEFLSLGAVIVMAIVTWWKNNSFTEEAIKSDEQMKKMKGKRNNASL